MADRLAELARRGGADPRPLLSVVELFGEVLPRSREFVNQVADLLRQFELIGVEATLAKFVCFRSATPEIPADLLDPGC